MLDLTCPTPDTFFLVAVNFARLGFGSGGDPVTEFDQACDQLAEALVDGDQARVFRIDMDADNMPAGISDVTHDALDSVNARLDARGYSNSEIEAILGAA